MGAIADQGLSPSQWTSARLHSEVLYLETHRSAALVACWPKFITPGFSQKLHSVACSTRYELSRLDQSNTDAGATQVNLCRLLPTKNEILRPLRKIIWSCPVPLQCYIEHIRLLDTCEILTLQSFPRRSYSVGPVAISPCQSHTSREQVSPYLKTWLM